MNMAWALAAFYRRHALGCRNALGVAILSSFCSVEALGHNFQLDLSLGGDTNPNELSDVFEVDSAYNLAAAFKFDHESKGSGYFYELSAYGNRFADDKAFEDGEALTNARNGETNSGFAQVGLKWAPVRYGRAADFRLEANYEVLDQIFVYTPSGDVAVVRNNFGLDIVIDNRFDSETASVLAALDLPLSEEAEFFFSFGGRDRTYTNYIDLPNLDYQQVELGLGFNKLIWPKVSLRNAIDGALREYIERPARDLDGDFLVDTNLEFKFLAIENTLTYHISNRWDWDIGLRFEQRQDNEEGYYDVDDASAYMRFGYKNRDIIAFNLWFAYTERDFENTDDNASLAYEEEIVERRGGQLRAEFMRNLNYGGWRTIDLLLGVSYEDFEHDDTFFTYDQAQAYVGIRWRPY